jgi:UDP-N-acetylmuramoylalanine--D-glutamate ligase
VSEFAGRSVAVIGLAATGLATARVLRDRGARVTVYDGQPEEKLSVARVAEARSLGEGVSLRFGTSDLDWAATDLVIPSPGVPRSARPLAEAVSRGVEVMGEIEAAYRLAQAPILAITGTNGKTTTTALLGAICREAGLPTWVAGNIAEDAGVRLPLIEAATQAPADGVIVAEISSFQLEWVTTFRPKVAAWLNITNDHLDRHADLAEYAEAKSNIFRAQTEDEYAVVNADDENVVIFSEGIGAGRRRWFGTGQSVHDLALLYAAYDGGENLYVGEGDSRELLLTRAEIPIPGRHNVSNVLAAAAMALSFGISIDAVRAGVRGFKGVAHRMEPVGEVGGVRYINNSMCTNPAAVAASLEAVGGPAVAIAGGKHKGGDLSPLTNALRQYAKGIVLIGEAAPVLAALLDAEAGGPSHETAVNLPDAVARAAARAQGGDTVILVPGCASFDMFTGFEHRGQVFREAVAALRRQD